MTSATSPLLSIIIPVYNAEKYLRQTLDSIVEQPRIDECEIIAVNDGSADSSLTILREYSSRFTNIRIIDKPNEGVSIARNVALGEVSGRYCLFIDADDLLHPDALGIILTILSAEEPDILVWNYAPFYSHPRKSPIPDIKPQTLKSTEAFNFLMDKGCGVGLWLKAFSSRLLDNIRFIPGMTFGEDMFFGWKAMACAGKIIFIDSPLYLYRQTNCNATSRFHPGVYESYSRAFDELRTFFAGKGLLTSELERDMDYHFAKRLPSLAAMEIKAPYSRAEQTKHFEAILADPHISAALRSDRRIKGHVYDLARDSLADTLLAEARSQARKSKLLYYIKRLIK